MRFINERVWLLVLLAALVISSFYLLQTGKRTKRAYAGGRVVERTMRFSEKTVWKRQPKNYMDPGNRA